MPRKRTSAKKRTEILAFVEQYNSEHGRGGVGEAAKQFNVKPETIYVWVSKSKTTNDASTGSTGKKSEGGEFQISKRILKSIQKIAVLKTKIDHIRIDLDNETALLTNNL